MRERTASPTQRRSFIFAAVFILLLGVLVRLSVLDFFGLDGDDIASLMIARSDPGTIIDGLLNIRLDFHPPLHFLLLKGWVSLAGESLLALRTMNVLLNLLIGAGMIRIASRVYGRRGGLIAGALWVAAPGLIFPAYMIRMYTLLTLWATLGLLCLLEAHRSAKRWPGWLLGAAVCGLAGIYTHIIGLIVCAALGFGALLVAWPRHKALLLALGSFGLTGFLALPYLLPLWSFYRANGSRVTGQFSFYAFDNPLDVPGTILSTLLVHRLSPGQLGVWLLVPLLALLTWLIWRRFGRRSAVLLAVFWFALVALTGMAWFGRIYKTFYIAAFVPAALLIITGGILLIRRRHWQAGLFVGAVILLSWGALNDLDHTVRDDPVAAAQFIQQHERPGDMVLVVPDWADELFSYHYHGQLPVVGAFPGVAADMDLDTLLPYVTEGYSGVWIVRFQVPATDPDNLLDAWFSQHAATGTAVYPTNIPVSYYDLQPQMTQLPEDARPLDVQFGDVVALRGVWMPLTEGSARDTRLHPPSNWVQVALYWEVLQPGADFLPRVQLTDPYGQVYGGALDLNPQANVLNRWPVRTWEPGQIWRIIYNLNLNPATPPGTYNIEVMVFDPASGERLPASGADAGEAWALPGQFVVR